MAGNLASMSVVGPTVVVHSPTFIEDSTSPSGNWAGSSWWGSGSPTPTIISTTSDEVYPTISTVNDPPQNLPKGDSLHQVTSVWDGLTNAQNYLLQTGLYTDATEGMTYGQTFYELACNPGSYCPSGPDFYMSGQLQQVPFGHTANEEVIHTSSETQWIVGVDDYNTGIYAQQTYNIAQWLPNGFVPQWTQYIVETPTSSGLVQQLASFSGVVVGDATYCSTNQCWTTYDQSYNDYQLQQSGSGANVNLGYRNADCGFHGDYGCPTVSYINSNYDYNYMLSHYKIG